MNYIRKLVNNCSPTLLGLKPSNLFSISNEDYTAMEEQIEKTNLKMSFKGLKTKVFCRCKYRKLIFLYNEDYLEKTLLNSEVHNYLISIGYPSRFDLDTYILHLVQKVENEIYFPHEIGLFLGMPKEDVMGFINMQGKGFKCFGYWKVYGDEDMCKRLFEEYDKSKHYLEDRYNEGIFFECLLREREEICQK